MEEFSARVYLMLLKRAADKVDGLSFAAEVLEQRG
jgi:hypothetical protein